MLHAIIRDSDIGYENRELNNPYKRIGARGIVVKGGVRLLYSVSKI